MAGTFKINNVEVPGLDKAEWLPPETVSEGLNQQPVYSMMRQVRLVADVLPMASWIILLGSRGLDGVSLEITNVKDRNGSNGTYFGAVANEVSAVSHDSLFMRGVQATFSVLVPV